MKIKSLTFNLLLALLALMPPELALAEQIRVAVASNFTNVIKHLAGEFENNTDHRVTLIFGSTGKHYSQIINGAPYDVLFAADTVRPELLENTGKAIADSRFIYAIGKLVLWSPEAKLIDSVATVLRSEDFRFLAIANPRLAPYGMAAQEVLEAQGLWNQLQGKLVRGENIGQTFQFVKSGNAQLGFVAISQIQRSGQVSEGSYWEIPQSLYTPIQQQAVLLKENATARAFMGFVQSNEGQAIIRSYGYDTP